MKEIGINWAPRSFRRAAILTQPLTWFFGCIGFVLCVTAVVDVMDLVQQRSAQLVTLQNAKAKFLERTAHHPAPKKVMISEGEAAAINAAVAQLNLPWRDVWDAIEAATPPTIALLALEPDAKKHSAKGWAEAKTSDEMIGYVEQLKQQAFFGNVVLTKHEQNEQDPNKPLRFQFDALWAEGGE